MESCWHDISKLLDDGESTLVIERVRIPEKKLSIEGEFRLPSLAALPDQDQVFVAAFIQSHGSIKEMERLFGISYPSVKNRLNKIASRLGVLDISPKPSIEDSTSRQSEILDRLWRGEISADQATRELRS